MSEEADILRRLPLLMGSPRLKMIQSILISLLKWANKSCAQEDLMLVAKLFDRHSKSDVFPGMRRYVAPDGETTYGFYYVFLKATTIEANPDAFYQMLTIDQKIGWTNPVHVEHCVFYFKAIKIIQDEKNWAKWCHFHEDSLTSFVDISEFTNPRIKQSYELPAFGDVAQIIWQSFVNFVLRAEQTGNRSMEEWIKRQDTIGDNVITKLFAWTVVLIEKNVQGPLVDKLVKWIVERKLTMFPAPLNLSYFHPWAYSASQATALIQKGFNPKVSLYFLPDEFTRYQAKTTLAIKLGSVFTSAKEDFWFCFEDSKCNQACAVNCPDKKGRFIQYGGFRVQKAIKIDEDKFGSVYEGQIHGQKTTAKFIKITDEFKRIIASANSINDVTEALIHKVASKGAHELNNKPWWFQFSKGSLIELVILTPKQTSCTALYIEPTLD